MRINRIAVLWIVMLVFVATLPTASAATLSHTPSQDVDLSSDGDSYTFEIDTSETAELQSFSVNMTATENGDSFSQVDLDIEANGVYVGTFESGVVFDETVETTISGYLNTSVAAADTTTITLTRNSSTDDSITNVEWRSGDSMTIEGAGFVELSNATTTGTAESPAELSVDVSEIRESTELTFRDGDGNTIATKEVASNRTVSAQYNWTVSDVQNGSVDWSVEANGVTQSSSFTPPSNVPKITDVSPSGAVFNSPVELSANVSDDDFTLSQGDSLVLEWTNNGETVATQNVSSAGRYNATVTDPLAGENARSRPATATA